MGLDITASLPRRIWPLMTLLSAPELVLPVLLSWPR